MPTIRKYHGNVIGAELHEVSEEEHAVLVAQYHDLKARAERAAANAARASTADLKAARQALELAYQLQRDEEYRALRKVTEACEGAQREREVRAAQERAATGQRVTDVLRAIEAMGAAVATLGGAPSPDELPREASRQPIDPASLEGADLDRARIAPTMGHENHRRQAERLRWCLDVLSGGVPAAARKRAAALVEELLRRNEEADAVDLADLESIAAEQARRDEEAERKARAEAEAERLPETMMEMRELIAELQSKLS